MLIKMYGIFNGLKAKLYLSGPYMVLLDCCIFILRKCKNLVLYKKMFIEISI
jgi:hypothetical protein